MQHGFQLPVYVPEQLLVCVDEKELAQQVDRCWLRVSSCTEAPSYLCLLTCIGFNRDNPLESVTTEPRLLLTDPRQVAAAREPQEEEPLPVRIPDKANTSSMFRVWSWCVSVCVGSNPPVDPELGWERRLSEEIRKRDARAPRSRGCGARYLLDGRRTPRKKHPVTALQRAFLRRGEPTTVQPPAFIHSPSSQCRGSTPETSANASERAESRVQSCVFSCWRRDGLGTGSPLLPRPRPQTPPTRRADGQSGATGFMCQTHGCVAIQMYNSRFVPFVLGAVYLQPTFLDWPLPLFPRREHYKAAACENPPGFLSHLAFNKPCLKVKDNGPRVPRAMRQSPVQAGKQMSVWRRRSAWLLRPLCVFHESEVGGVRALPCQRP
ncbi:unnamed protein product [Pleuronectes platessa]|uniref:Uncharacterized protein n=1 Tax=Pleuronectes platessa TaxID=8262 RepID=A0A9N7VHL9_PLEPL|nr:unnamed protein product [Pleuronectes platessa]